MREVQFQQRSHVVQVPRQLVARRTSQSGPVSHLSEQSTTPLHTPNLEANRVDTVDEGAVLRQCHQTIARRLQTPVGKRAESVPLDVKVQLERGGGGGESEYTRKQHISSGVGGRNNQQRAAKITINIITHPTLLREPIQTQWLDFGGEAGGAWVLRTNTGGGTGAGAGSVFCPRVLTFG